LNIIRNKMEDLIPLVIKLQEAFDMLAAR